MRRFLALVACLAVACAPDGGARVPTRIEILSMHQRACEAKGRVLVEQDRQAGEVCTATALRLARLTQTDEDCRAYYGDAGITLDLCDAPQRKRIELDGGAE